MHVDLVYSHTEYNITSNFWLAVLEVRNTMPAN